MIDFFVDYIQGIAEGGIVVIAIIALFVLLLLGLAIRLIRKRYSVARDVISPVSREVKTAKKGAKSTAKQEEVYAPILGTGNYKCMAFRLGRIIDFTTMPVPLGEIHQFDTSCPVSGGGYVVRELENGQLEEYDPREVAIIDEETPEYAWFATHWSIVAKVFSVPLSIWKNPSTYFAIALVVIFFIFGLVVFGGQ